MTVRRKYTIGNLGRSRYLVHGNSGEDKFLVERYETADWHADCEWDTSHLPKFCWNVSSAERDEWQDEFGRTCFEWVAGDLLDDAIVTRRAAVQLAIDIDFARHNPMHGPTREDYPRLNPVHGPTRAPFRRCTVPGVRVAS